MRGRVLERTPRAAEIQRRVEAIGGKPYAMWDEKDRKKWEKAKGDLISNAPLDLRYLLEKLGWWIEP